MQTELTELYALCTNMPFETLGTEGKSYTNIEPL